MKKFVLIPFLLFIISCSTQSVSIDYDRTQDFSQIRDFKIEWTDNTVRELNVNRIQNAIQNELAQKSMVLNENSDNVLSINANEFTSQSQNSNIGVGVGSGGRSFGTSIGMNIPITSEKLNQVYLVSLYNTAGQLVWQGKMSIQMPEDSSGLTIETNIKKGVQKLFKNYPPKK